MQDGQQQVLERRAGTDARDSCPGHPAPGTEGSCIDSQLDDLCPKRFPVELTEDRCSRHNTEKSCLRQIAPGGAQLGPPPGLGACHWSGKELPDLAIGGSIWGHCRPKVRGVFPPRSGRRSGSDVPRRPSLSLKTPRRRRAPSGTPRKRRKKPRRAPCARRAPPAPRAPSANSAPQSREYMPGRAAVGGRRTD